MSNKPKQEGQATEFRRCYNGIEAVAGVILTKGDIETSTLEVAAIAPARECSSAPYIFAGSLSDEELIAFLEEIIVKLMSRKRLTGRPEHLREEAFAIEEKLNETNGLIDSVVVRQGQNSSRNL